MSREIMQQALDAFEEIMFTKNVGSSHIIAKNARYALREELAKPEHPLDKKADNARELGLDYEPEQEPVAWVTRRTGDGGVVLSGYETCEPTDYDATPVYTAPPSTSGYAKKIESLIKERDELRKALAQPEQEPVAWVEPVSNRIWITREDLEKIYKQPDVTFINEGNKWQGLTDDDLRQIILSAVGVAEAKLKLKNIYK